MVRHRKYGTVEINCNEKKGERNKKNNNNEHAEKVQTLINLS